MSKTKDITAKQYAAYLGCTEANVSKHIRNGKWQFIPDVLRLKRYSRFYLLVVDANLPIPESN